MTYDPPAWHSIIGVARLFFSAPHPNTHAVLSLALSQSQQLVYMTPDAGAIGITYVTGVSHDENETLVRDDMGSIAGINGHFRGYFSHHLGQDYRIPFG
jgi:hypothetical protein